MKNGKVSQAVLKRSVFKQLHSHHPSVLQGPGPGVDAAVISLSSEGKFSEGDSSEQKRMVMATESVPVSACRLAARSVNAALNNVAAAGAMPVGIMASVTIPTLWNESQLRELMRDVDLAAAKAGVQTLGGHTTVSRNVKNAILTITASGLAEGRRVDASGAKPGMDIILTKWIALEGTSILAIEKEEALRSRFAQPFIDKAKEYAELGSVLPEAAVAVESGACAMHDVAEGGIFGALWELAEASGVGLEIDLKKIPIRQETVEITEFFDINPYKLLSGGSLLIAAEDGNSVVRELGKAGIPARVIGAATDSNDRVLLHDGERRFLETVQADEIYQIFENVQ